MFPNLNGIRYAAQAALGKPSGLNPFGGVGNSSGGNGLETLKGTPQANAAPSTSSSQSTEVAASRPEDYEEILQSTLAADQNFWAMQYGINFNRT
jgi:hypothetical protein